MLDANKFDSVSELDFHQKPLGATIYAPTYIIRGRYGTGGRFIVAVWMFLVAMGFGSY